MRRIAKLTRATLTSVSLVAGACREVTSPEPKGIVTVAASVGTVGPKDNRPPTAPSGLRATGVTPYTVSLAWSPSSDNSGVFSYHVRNSVGYEFTVPQAQTTFTWTYGLAAQTTYSFSVYAVDAAGNASKSTTTSVTTARDVTAPTAPVISVGDVGPTHITLAWLSSDDGPVQYSISVSGTLVSAGTSSTARTFDQLTPATNYTFTITARDNAGNASAPSQVTVATRSSDFIDTAAPTAPSNLSADGFSDGSTELLITWTASADNVDPRSLLRYEVFINGELNEVTVGTTRSTGYGVVGANTITVFAIDAAGNRSAAGTTTVVITL